MSRRCVNTPGPADLEGIDMEDDSEFERLVTQTQRNAEDIQRTILGNLRRRLAVEVTALLAVLAAAVVITVYAIGWLGAIILYAFVTPVAIVYGVWSWKRKFRQQPINRESL